MNIRAFSTILVIMVLVSTNLNNKVGAEANLFSKWRFKKEIENFGEKQTNKVPLIYSKKEALKNGDITFFKERTSEQKKKITEFKNNVKNKKPDFIRFTQFTSNGDAVITEYQFNGKIIYYRYDSSRDRTDQHRKGTFVKGKFVKGSHIVEDYCKKLVPNSKMSYITNCYKYDKIEF
ncbi:hypothetical protein AB1282_20150 [Gottfriedia sp. S16(2024)]|uniref:hypothetical protein n=1 Tax=Gottfriedia sp. S16(2024) TaxID=3162883 RepID=UPI003D1EEF93